MIPSPAAVALVQRFEGLRLEPYCCSGGRWTIGYGHTSGITPLTPAITPEAARNLLADDLAGVALAVENLLTVPVTQGQFDALVSFAFNCGSGALARSTLLRLLNQGDATGAAQQFSRWDKAKGMPLEGLARRRAAERAMFEGGST
jgi:lysozyme